MLLSVSHLLLQRYIALRGEKRRGEERKNKKRAKRRNSKREELRNPEWRGLNRMAAFHHQNSNKQLLGNGCGKENKKKKREKKKKKKP